MKNSENVIVNIFLIVIVISTVPVIALADSRDDAVFGESAKPAEEKPLADTLAVGGRLEVAGSSAQAEQQEFPEAGFTTLKQADLFLDARPEKDLRAFVRARFSEATPVDPTVRAAGGEPCDPCVTTDLDEAWFKWNHGETVFVTVGKQHLKWGSGRFWNPTDFTATEAKDPFAQFDRRLGKDLVKLHLPFEKQGHNLYAIVEMADAERNDEMGAALRGEFAFGGVGEAALTFETRQDHPIHAGADVSVGLGAVDVNVETAATRRETRLLYTGDIDPETGTLPTGARPDEQRTFVQTVSGVSYTLKYSDEDNLTVGGEFFLNGLGYEDRELELFALANRDAQPLYAGKRYAGAYVRAPEPGSFNDATYYVSGIRNLSDESAVIRLTGVFELAKHASVEAFASRCLGDYGELCFRVPSSYAAFAAHPALSDEQKRLLASLPTRRTVSVVGLGVSMGF